MGTAVVGSMLFGGRIRIGVTMVQTHDAELRDRVQKQEARTASPPDRVRMTGIAKRFGPIQTLSDVSLRLAPGEVLGHVGDNGAGKSTLSKVLSGAVVPDGGTIEIDGKAVSFASPADAQAEHVEMVYQDLSLCGTRSTLQATSSSGASRGAAWRR